MKGNVLVTIVSSVPSDMGTSTVPGHAMSCTLDCFLATAVDWFLSFTLHEPITCSCNCVIEKGFSEGEKRDFPILTVLVPISQGTKVTKVTEYISSFLNVINDNQNIMGSLHSAFLSVKSTANTTPCHMLHMNKCNEY